jgi:hypothetical protein
MGQGIEKKGWSRLKKLLGVKSYQRNDGVKEHLYQVKSLQALPLSADSQASYNFAGAKARLWD